MINEFSTSVIEKIGHYVYCLIDPRDQQVFYIGKGKGNRVFSHLNCAIETAEESDKLEQIREIKKAGFEQPEHYILRDGLTEEKAEEIEATLIDFAKLCEKKNFKLKNLIRGFGFERGAKTTLDIIQLYGAKPIIIDEPVLIIVVNKLYKYGMTSEDLFDIVHEKWVLSPERLKNVKFVLAGYRDIVREVYEVNDWYKIYDDVSKKERYGFHGKIVNENIRQKYLNQSLEKYKGNGNPIRYVNC